MTSEIAYNISTSSGPDPGRSVITANNAKDIKKDSNSTSNNNVVQLNRQDTAARQDKAENKNNSPNEAFLKTIKEEFDLINQVKLKFAKDNETGQPFIEIVDKDSGDVVREIPPEFMRKLAEKMDEMVGILFDQKA